jgi:Asp-tRNAAsn/Glu-tRNAGln amidotransferase B subunit (PET112 homolog)
VQKAIEYEIERQKAILLEGKAVEQETRGFDPQSGKTFVMRTKEEAEDYRYFKDPDLLPLIITKELLKSIKDNMPELPDERIERLMKDYGLSRYEASVLTNLKELGDFFQEATKYTKEYKALSNWLLNDVLGFMNENQIEEIPITPQHLAKLVELIKQDVISTKIAKEVIKEMLTSKKDPDVIIEEKGLKQISNEDEIKAVVISVLEKFPQERERLKNGEEKLIGFLVGEVMKITKGKANPKLVNKLIRECL